MTNLLRAAFDVEALVEKAGIVRDVSKAQNHVDHWQPGTVLSLYRAAQAHHCPRRIQVKATPDSHDKEKEALCARISAPVQDALFVLRLAVSLVQ
eukprot:1143494-Rhodomonas_salina.1